MKDRDIRKKGQAENPYPPRPTRAEKDRRIRENLGKLRSKPKEKVVFFPKITPTI